jgi:hypothetical protein
MSAMTVRLPSGNHLRNRQLGRAQADRGRTKTGIVLVIMGTSIFAALSPLYGRLFVHLLRTSWGRTIMIDTMRALLVFSVVMVGVGLWLSLVKHRTRPLTDPGED